MSLEVQTITGCRSAIWNVRKKSKSIMRPINTINERKPLQKEHETLEGSQRQPYENFIILLELKWYTDWKNAP